MSNEFDSVEIYESEPDIGAWHRWYARHLQTVNEYKVGSAGVVIGSWLRLARPLALLVQGMSADEDSAPVIAGEGGGWYILSPAEPELVDCASWLLRADEASHRGRLMRDLKPWGRVRWIYDPMHPERTTRGVTRLRGSRRYGLSPRTGRSYRSGPHPDGQAVLRALVVRGLMETADLSHGAALHVWALWPEASVPAAVGEALTRITGRSRGSRHLPQAERDARLADRLVRAAWERSIRRQLREIWLAQGLTNPDGSPTGTSMR